MRFKRNVLLIILFILVLGIRLYFAFQTPNFSYDDAYFNLRQASTITEKGLPSFYDSLSYGGRTYFFAPLFFYLLSLFHIVFPITIVGKVIPNVFASALLFVVFLIANKLTDNEDASLFTAFISGFIPIYFVKTLNNVSIFSLAIPLFFLTIYFLMKLEDDAKYLKYFLISLVLLLFTHSSGTLLILSMIFFILLLKLEQIALPKYLFETTIFAVLFTLWLQLVMFKNVFLQHGLLLIWQNIPAQIFSQYFSTVSIFQALTLIGFVPLLCGLYILYMYVFKQQNTNVYLLFSSGFTIFVLLWLKVIHPVEGLVYLGVTLAIIFGLFYKMIMDYFEDTKFPRLKIFVFGIIILALILTSIIPTLTFAQTTINNSPTSKEIDAFVWIRLNSNENSVVLATYKEGNMITAISERRNVMDSKFILIDDINQRFSDIETIYTTPYKIEAIRILNKYNVNYIVVSEDVREMYGIENLKYAGDSCFKLVYDNDVMIYESSCHLEEYDV